MTDPDSHRRDIALAEQEVEQQRAGFRRRTLETRQRIDAVNERIRGWKAPSILVGGALLGLVIGRSGRPRRGPLPQREEVQHGAAAGAAKTAGRTAALMAGLSLAARALPMVLPLLRAFAARR